MQSTLVTKMFGSFSEMTGDSHHSPPGILISVINCHFGLNKKDTFNRDFLKISRPGCLIEQLRLIEL